ncbi:hypothetical protein COCNU_07G001420 [Cocos nucifera]|uniref:Pre-mRNA-processing factor 39 n=1 Tax=Cocos nucifera TaxID=13894 RepID=A0A8K0IDQ3_COCNU|nr:hypothetical protein COCNU_07G001420 [Cocos nucifera]
MTNSGGEGLVSCEPTAATDYALSDSSNPRNGNMYKVDNNSVAQNAGMAYESKPDGGAAVASEIAIGHETVADISSHTTGYDSMNGGASEVASYQSTGVIENGGFSNDVGSTVLQQPYEDVVYTAEEERLWNMVRANCLDFNSWTALIEETEKVAELCGYLQNEVDFYLKSCVGFKELAASRSLSEIQTPEEAAMAAANAETGGQSPEGEVHPDAVEQSPKPVSAGLTEAEELEKYIAIREEMYKKAKEYESKMIGFETAIRRPYFHVRPLDEPELENWHNYLDFIERGDDFNKVVKLYERCLIACANYPEFWIRYVLCMEASGSMELANNALARATQVFVKKQPEIHLFSARFKELSGDVLGARVEYQLLYSEISPGLLEAIVKHANMENRLGDRDAAFSLYEKAITAEQEKEQSLILPMLLAQYSRFVYLVAGNAEKAREILAGSLEYIQLSKPLLEAVIHLESIQPSPKHVDYLDSLVEKFIMPNPDHSNMASTTDREEISSIFLEPALIMQKVIMLIVQGVSWYHCMRTSTMYDLDFYCCIFILFNLLNWMAIAETGLLVEHVQVYNLLIVGTNCSGMI